MGIDEESAMFLFTKKIIIKALKYYAKNNEFGSLMYSFLFCINVI